MYVLKNDPHLQFIYQAAYYVQIIHFLFQSIPLQNISKSFAENFDRLALLKQKFFDETFPGMDKSNKVLSLVKLLNTQELYL
jgi:hypothetical protein